MHIDRYRNDLSRLVSTGHKLLLAIALEAYPTVYKHVKLTVEERAALPDVRTSYQRWYSESLSAVTQLLPGRVEDFVSYYKPLKPRKVIGYHNYTILDCLQGVTVLSNDRWTTAAAIPVLKQQVHIVESILNRFESALFDIRSLVQADLLDNELDSADELNIKGFHRAAGVVAGVALEGHLANICIQHKMKHSNNPTIAELNDGLKNADIVDLPTWRFIQRLGDIRNLCGHKKKDEPTKDNISELISGVRKTIKTVF